MSALIRYAFNAGVAVNKAAWSTRYTGVVALPKIDLMQSTLLRPFHRDGWIFEGYVAKDEASPYSGGRTLSWFKVKQKEYRVEERGWSLSAR